MDFAESHICQESVATRSKICHIPVSSPRKEDEKDNLDDMLLQAANQAAVGLFLGNGHGSSSNRNKSSTPVNMEFVDSSLYPERLTPQHDTIQPNQIVVIFESFDNLKFCYAQPGEIFSNRNGHFHHNDFIGKPYGCKIRSRNNRGYGFVYLLKPTPELWARSLNHRTQIIHELDASMIVFYLNLKPNMVVCESGTGSGALSHCIMRTIAPAGKLHTYEFNQARADTARQEFAKNRVGHLVNVYHKDACGKGGKDGGFDRPQASVDAIILDLPEPWLAVPHTAYCLKPNGRIASYSPCIEQSQRTCTLLRQFGFHSIKTMEFRLQEHYVDEVEYELAPKEKRPRLTHNPHQPGIITATAILHSGGEDTGAEADNEKSEYETEGDNSNAKLSIAKESNNNSAAVTQNTNNAVVVAGEEGGDATAPGGGAMPATKTATTTGPTSVTQQAYSSSTSNTKRKKVLVARPFAMMRGHTAFLTFATAGNKIHPDPNKKKIPSAGQQPKV